MDAGTSHKRAGGGMQAETESKSIEKCSSERRSSVSLFLCLFVCVCSVCAGVRTVVAV
jgi:hypothetical protein